MSVCCFALRRMTLAVGFALSWLSASFVFAQAASPAPVDFAREVQPLLARRCFACHGPDKGEGGFRLHDGKAALAKLESGEHGIVPGKPDKSEMIARVSATDDEVRMPPKGKALSEKEVDTLKRWIAGGAKYEPHWGYEKPVRLAAPEVKNKAWVKNPIDAFILAKLESRNLSPAPPAEKAALIRRLYYDLTGLPPTADEVAAFVADKSDNAYEKVVDKLLESPRYGERWARHWLDAVRYADTNSFERDGLKPHSWRYRDYVIRSLNSDKPYDRFLREQLAGDEMPEPTADDYIATGFYRLGLWDDEPADKELAKFDHYDDLVTTVSQGILGMTVNCARCHDHKIDPITQKDYYSLVSFFRGTTMMGNGGADVERAVTDDDGKMGEASQVDVKRRIDDIQANITEIEKEFLQKYIPDSSTDLVDLEYRIYHEHFDRLPDFDTLKPFATGAVRSQKLDLGLSTRDSDFAFVFSGSLQVPADGEYTFVVDADDGVRLSLDGKKVAERDGVHGIGEPVTTKVALKKGKVPLKLEYFQGIGGQGLEVAWSGPEVTNRALSAANNDLYASQRRRGGRRRPDVNSTAALIAQHGARVLNKERAEQYTNFRAKLEELRKERATTAMALVITERGSQPPETNIMLRGSPHSPGDKVEPEFIKVLGGGAAKIEIPESKQSSGRRTALANWIASGDNPMTARVMVNRIWQHHFGRGIVRSPNNFGLLGDPPTHRELLDYLATEFVAKEWKLKAMHKLIVMSNTYQMSSQGSAAALAVDPGNDLFWRYNMRRLGAEELRDSVYAVNGRLNLKMYGPGVYPTLSAEVKATQSAPGSGWGNSTAEEQARRSIYVHLKRSLVTPLLAAFDFPDTDTTCEARFDTTQPGQSLALFNGDFMNGEAAELAKQVKAKAGADVEAQVATAIKLALGRDATEKEITRGIALIDKLQKQHGQTAEQAFKHYCLYVYNLNEFVYLD